MDAGRVSVRVVYCIPPSHSGTPSSGMDTPVERINLDCKCFTGSMLPQRRCLSNVLERLGCDQTLSERKGRNRADRCVIERRCAAMTQSARIFCRAKSSGLKNGGLWHSRRRGGEDGTANDRENRLHGFSSVAFASSPSTSASANMQLNQSPPSGSRIAPARSLPSPGSGIQ